MSFFPKVLQDAADAAEVIILNENLWQKISNCSQVKNLECSGWVGGSGGKVIQALNFYDVKQSEV